jgi:outer membrane protein insertion porin family
MIKRFFTSILCIIALFTLFESNSARAEATQSFSIAAIKINGLHRISRETTLDYLGFSPGQTFNVADSNQLIKKLYATGFFSDVSVRHEGNVLIVDVTEQPTIASVKVTGYQSIDKDKINEVLKTTGLVEGHEYDPATAKKFIDSLSQQYIIMGRYNAHIETNISKPDSRNRVSINITISEGRVAKIDQIHILGNKAFSEKKLIRQLDLSTTDLISFFTKDDQFSQEKLDHSKEKLIDFYQNHGYLHAKIDSAQAQLSPKRDSIYVIIKVTEGEQYTVSQIKISGKTIVPVSDLEKMLKLKSGDIFSKEKIKESQKKIIEALGDQGYAFANITVTPLIDEANKTVAVTLLVDPGHQVYIRHVTFTGNNQTSNLVLRRELRQLEGALSSTSQIKESQRRIQNLGTYITDAQSTVVAIPGKSDQIDLNYAITESPPATAMGQVSYGTDGFGYGASLNNYNLLGTGKALHLTFNHTPYVTSYNVSYINPYYTLDGISRAINFYAQQFNPGSVNIANYSYQNFGGGVNYGVPISEKNDRITFGYGYQNDKLGVGQSPSLQVLNFFQEYNTPQNESLIFNQAMLNIGWGRNNLDRAFFPTRGLTQSASAQLSEHISGKKLQYYTLGYNAKFYHPIAGDVIFSSLAAVNFGNGFGSTSQLPFFQNFYSGGVGSVRGFTNNTLGPRDSLNNPIGGNLSANGTAAIIFPNYISPDSLRTAWFVDGGNVYNTHAASAVLGGASNPYSGPVRFSTGLDIEWKIPVVGLIDVSFAKPINAKPGDQKDWFQFNFGTQF